MYDPEKPGNYPVLEQRLAAAIDLVNDAFDANRRSTAVLKLLADDMFIVSRSLLDFRDPILWREVTRVLTADRAHESLARLDVFAKDHDRLINHNVVMLSHQAVEIFLGDTLRAIYSTLPGYLYMFKGAGDAEQCVAMSELFTVDSVEHLRALSIDAKVKALVQGNNLLELSDKPFKRLHVTLPVDRETKVRLIRLTALRNVLAHAGGKVTGTYLRLLRQFEIPTVEQLGDTITIEEFHIPDILTAIGQIVEQWHAKLSDSVVSLVAHHESKRLKLEGDAGN